MSRSQEREYILAGQSLAAETGGLAGEESALKAGWLPHKARTLSVGLPAVAALIVTRDDVIKRSNRCSQPSVNSHLDCGTRGPGPSTRITPLFDAR